MTIKNSKGFTIIEVLIAMVILSVGVLSLGVLQLSALQNTHGGQMRSQATILGYDIIDSMRVNIPAVTGGDYRIALDAATPDAANCYGAAANCTTDQMAASDLRRWRTVLGNYLPSGSGQVETTDIGGATQVSVAITWVDPFSAESGNERLVLVAELPQ
jgi:type IV pilus assembly protein PilV